MQANTKKISSSIDIVKFIISIHVIFAHLADLGVVVLDNAYIYIEWFFVFIGYNVARKIAESDLKYDSFHMTCEIIKSRIVNILPYYLVSCTLAVIIKTRVGLITYEDPWIIHRIIFDYLMLYMMTFSVYHLTNVSWFLSAVWLALIILVPLAVKFKHKFFRLGLLIYIIIYFYIYKAYEVIWDPDFWTPFGYKGFLRAVGSISLGMFAYELGLFLKDKFKNYILESIFIIIAYAIIFIQFDKYEFKLLFYFLPIIFAFLIIVQMNSKKFIIPDCAFTRILGKISMVIFLNHFYIYMAIDKLSSASPYYKAKIGIIGCIIASTFVYLIVDLYKYVKKSLKSTQVSNV